MKNIFKVITLFLTIIIISGCSAYCDVKMNYDGVVTEKVDVVNSNDKLKYGNKGIQYSLDLYLKKYDTALKLGGYNTESHVGKKESGVTISRDYDNICKFIQNTIFSQYVYRKFECNEDDDYYEIKSVGSVIRNTDRYDTWLSPDNIVLKMTFPFSLSEQNADKISGNTYIWKFDSKTDRSKNVYFKVSKESLLQSKLEHEASLKRQRLIKILFVTLGVVVLVLIALFISNKLRNNKYE